MRTARALKATLIVIAVCCIFPIRAQSLTYVDSAGDFPDCYTLQNNQESAACKPPRLVFEERRNALISFVFDNITSSKAQYKGNHTVMDITLAAILGLGLGTMYYVRRRK